MNVRLRANLNEEVESARKGTEMDARTDLNRYIVNDRMRDRINDAAAERLAAEAGTRTSKVASQSRFRFEIRSFSGRVPSKA